MHGLMFTLAALAGAFLLIGVARITAWVLDRRIDTAIRPIRDAVFVAQASAEIRRG